MAFFELFIYFCFLGGSLYLYNYSLGNLKYDTPLEQTKYNKYIAKNGRWLRILALAVTAVMTVNIYFLVKMMME